MSADLITTRDLCAYIDDDSKESLDRIQTWVARGLFEAADCEPPKEYRHTGRGRARRYPEHAKYWCAAFRRLFDKGFAAREIAGIPDAVLLREATEPGFIERVAKEGKPVWLAYVTAADEASIQPKSEELRGAVFGIESGESTIADGAPAIPPEWGAWNGVIRAVNISWLFSRGHH